MSAPRRLTVVIAASVAGLILMLLQARQYFALHSGTAGLTSYCSFGAFDCHAIEASRYAELLPGMPLAAFAAAFFAGLAVIALFARNAYWRREAVRLGFAYTGFGVLVSATYLVIMLTQLSALCLFCLTVDTLIALSFAIFVSLKPEPLKPHKPEVARWKTMLGSASGAGVAILIVAKLMDPSEAIPAEYADRALEHVFSQTPIDVPLPPNPPTVGPKDAPITIVKFFDFQCPACKSGALATHPLQARYGDKIRFIYVSFPLDPACNRKMEHSMHPFACEAARLAYCAHTKGKYEAAYTAFFEKQEDLVKTGPLPLAMAATGMSKEELEACSKSAEAQAAVGRDVEDSLTLNIEATPTYYVNGLKVAGGLPTEVWIKVIDRLLEKR